MGGRGAKRGDGTGTGTGRGRYGVEDRTARWWDWVSIRALLHPHNLHPLPSALGVMHTENAVDPGCRSEYSVHSHAQITCSHFVLMNNVKGRGAPVPLNCYVKQRCPPLMSLLWRVKQRVTKRILQILINISANISGGSSMDWAWKLFNKITNVEMKKYSKGIFRPIVWSLWSTTGSKLFQCFIMVQFSFTEHCF